MSKQRIYLFVAAMVATTTLFSCRKKEDPVVGAQQGSLKVEVTNVMGGEAMSLSTLTDKWYTNSAGDSLKINVYKYYISNIVVRMADGKTYTEPESYHLINQEDPETRKITLTNVPTGKYTSISFLVGVDSVHNVSGAQAGDLDPGYGMLWSWNTGYIMAKMEGFSPSSKAADNALIFHIAGFSGENNVLKNVTLSFPEPADVSASNIPNVHVLADAQEWFKTPSPVSFADTYFIMTGGKQAKNIADNYADMFRVDHVDN